MTPAERVQQKLDECLTLLKDQTLEQAEGQAISAKMYDLFTRLTEITKK